MAGGPRFSGGGCYNKEARIELQAGGASAAAISMSHAEKMLPGAVCDVIHPPIPASACPRRGTGAI